MPKAVCEDCQSKVKKGCASLLRSRATLDLQSACRVLILRESPY